MLCLTCHNNVDLKKKISVYVITKEKFLGSELNILFTSPTSEDLVLVFKMYEYLLSLTLLSSVKKKVTYLLTYLLHGAVSSLIS